MKIYLNDYQEGVLSEVAGEYDPDQLDLEFIDLKYLEPVHMTGTVEKGPETLTFEGRLQTEVEHLCGRCLKTVEDKIDKSFQFYYEIKNQTMLETTHDLREILIIDHPITYLCREDCRGLCPQCGTDLNASACSCKMQTAAIRSKPFTSLKEAWERKHGGKQ